MFGDWKIIKGSLKALGIGLKSNSMLFVAYTFFIMCLKMTFYGLVAALLVSKDTVFEDSTNSIKPSQDLNLKIR